MTVLVTEDTVAVKFADGRVGEVRRVDPDGDVEDPPVVRLADVREELGDALDLAVLARRALQHREPELGDGSQKPSLLAREP